MSVQTTARALLTADQFAGVAATVARNNPEMAVELTERITEEAIKFVAAAAAAPGRGLRPSRIVDEGWHALILNTQVYARLCERLGMFVHHVPEPPMAPARFHPESLVRTQEAITDAGYTPDPMLWLAPFDTYISVAADCQHGSGGSTF